MNYFRRVDLCKYPMPAGVKVANEMLLEREHDTLMFRTAEQLQEFERRIREAVK